MYGHLKLLHISHSGRLRPHEHTSYAPLIFLIVVAGALLVRFSFSVYAATPYDGPEEGSIGLTGTLPGPPPKTAATISTPTDGQHFSSTPITVSGTCPKDTLVEIYKSNIFAGSTPCDDNGAYSLQIDLLFGQNVLTAQVYDVLNQAGPVSKSVTVFYDTALPQAAPTSLLNFTGAQLILNTDAAYRGTFPGQTLNVPITVIGGTAPFAINVQWGDTTNQLISRGDNSTFNASHIYKKPGTYKITLEGTDSKQLVAFLSVAAIVNGKPDVLVSSTTPKSTSSLLALWPLFAIAVTALISFWIGERREKHLLSKDNKTQTPGFGVVRQAPPQAPTPTP